MAINYEPSKIIKRLKLKSKAERLITNDLKVNRAALRTLIEMGVLPKRTAEKVALKVLKQYKEKQEAERDKGKTKANATKEALNDKKLIAARIQSAALHEQTKVIKKAFRGERYVWLPSTAKHPREEHKKNYGKVFILGEGEQPGDAHGCQCGMRLLIDLTDSEVQEILEGVI